MQKVIVVFSVLILIANGLVVNNCSAQAGHARPGARRVKSDTTTRAINFQAIDLQGKPFQAKTLKGKTVLLDFWAVWCAPCITAFPTLKKLNQDLKKENFEVVGVAVYSGTYKDVRPFVEKHNLDYKIVVGDGNLAERFGAIGFPTYFLIAPDGNIHRTYVGEAKNLYSDVKKEVVKLNKGKAR